MKRAVSATARESFALLQSLAGNIIQVGGEAGQSINPSILRSVCLATSLLLVGCASFELWSGTGPYSMVLIAAALALALAATGLHAEAEETPAEPPSRDRLLQSDIILKLRTQPAGARPVVSEGALNDKAWGDLMARVSHDLRTPLNAVIGFSDVMGSELFGPVGDQRYREYIAHIRDSGRELLKSAEDTLAMTALLGSAGAAGATNLSSLVVEAMRASNMAATVDVDGTLDVIGDRRALRQVLVNMLSEASQRCSAGAKARLSATCEDEFVILQVAVAGGVRPDACQQASLHVCMARVLLELQGAQLIEIDSDGDWRVVTVLDRAAQADFFASVPLNRGAMRARDVRLAC